MSPPSETGITHLGPDQKSGLDQSLITCVKTVESRPNRSIIGYQPDRSNRFHAWVIPRPTLRPDNVLFRTAPTVFLPSRHV